MHEHSFIDAILSNIEDRENVIAIEIEVGELAGIEAAHLKEHLSERVKWNITVTTKESLVECDCGYTGKADIQERLHDMVIYDCPKCGEVPEVTEGNNIKILKLTYK